MSLVGISWSEALQVEELASDLFPRESHSGSEDHKIVTVC
jgi:hypothetical protein